MDPEFGDFFAVGLDVFPAGSPPWDFGICLIFFCLLIRFFFALEMKLKNVPKRKGSTFMSGHDSCSNTWIFQGFMCVSFLVGSETKNPTNFG